MNQLLARATQIYVLILFILAIYLGAWPLLLVSVLIGWVLQGISLEVLIHRKYAHNQFEYKNRFWEYVAYLILLSTSLGRPVEWSYGHRVHHRYTDNPADPQSPHSIGKLKTLFSIFPSNVKGWDGIVDDLTSNKTLMLFNKFYYHLYLVYNIIWFSINPVLAIYFVGVPSVMTWTILGIVNTLAHTRKYSPDNLKFPLLFWGGNYHRTHHDSPGSIQLGKYDLSYYVIKCIKRDKPI
jgi:stearoyl-CoA desaturase (delta-9 desaturase)